MRTLYILIALVFSWFTYSQDFQTIQTLQSSDLETIKSKLMDLTGYKLAGEKAKGEYYLIALAPKNFTEQQIKEDKLNGYVDCVLFTLTAKSSGQFKLYEFTAKKDLMVKFAQLYYPTVTSESLDSNTSFRNYFNQEKRLNVNFMKNENTFTYTSIAM